MKFGKLVKEFHVLIKEVSSKFNDYTYEAQNALISRIYTFPLKIDLLSTTKAELPKVISKNKQFFEAIFTML